MRFTELAIIGPTASGKSDLALNLAKEHNAYILSLDSLAIYKEADIVSAKPSKEEWKEIKHVGIDERFINEPFSVDLYIELYKKAQEKAKKDNKNLIIVGGTSFYLKTLLEGISPFPNIDKETKFKVDAILKDIKNAYNLLEKIDKEYAKKISSNDRYRIEKALLIYFASGLNPSLYFKQNPKKPVIKNLKIYEIDIDRKTLRERIFKRTNKMLKAGLIDEICYLEKKYGRSPNPMKAIGIKETLDFLDGKIKTKDELIQKISINTGQLAKRQQTFNKTQFKEKTTLSLDKLYKTIIKDLSS